jgi:hypothetical protein
MFQRKHKSTYYLKNKTVFKTALMMSGALHPFSPVKMEKNFKSMKQFACKQCKKTLSYAYNLKRHMRLKHPGQRESNEKKEIKEVLKDLEKKEETVVISKLKAKVKPLVSKEKPAAALFPSHVHHPFPRKDALLMLSICQKCLHANQPLADQIKWFHNNNKFKSKHEKEEKEKARDLLIAKDNHDLF